MPVAGDFYFGQSKIILLFHKHFAGYYIQLLLLNCGVGEDS